MKHRDYIAKNMLWIALSMLAAGFIALGWYRGEWHTVFSKAIHICFQCIGLG